MRLIKIFSIIGISILGILSIMNCSGHCRHQSMTRERMEKKFNHIADKLDMTKEQKEKAKPIVDKVFEKMSNMKANRKETMTLAQKQFANDKFDKSALTTVVKTHEKDLTDMPAFMINTIAEFHAILTPDQRKKVVELMEKHHSKFQ